MVWAVALPLVLGECGWCLVWTAGPFGHQGFPPSRVKGVSCLARGGRPPTVWAMDLPLVLGECGFIHTGLVWCTGAVWALTLPSIATDPTSQPTLTTLSCIPPPHSSQYPPSLSPFPCSPHLPASSTPACLHAAPINTPNAAQTAFPTLSYGAAAANGDLVSSSNGAWGNAEFGYNPISNNLGASVSTGTTGSTHLAGSDAAAAGPGTCVCRWVLCMLRVLRVLCVRYVC